jgi:hypothetical protein
MKPLKMFGAAVTAAVALLAFVGAGSATATVLCSANEVPCSEIQQWPVATPQQWSLKAGTKAVFRLTGGTALVECAVAELSGAIANPGNANETVKVEVEQQGATWEGCPLEKRTLAGGELEYHDIQGTFNGTVVAKKFVTTLFTSTFGSCAYGYGEGANIGTLKGGADPIIAVNSVIGRVAGGLLCPATIKWTAEYTLTAPVTTSLYVGPE